MSLVDQGFILFYLPATVLAFHILRRWVSVDIGYALIVGLSLIALAFTSWVGLGLALGCVLVGYVAGFFVARMSAAPVRWALLGTAGLCLIGLLGALKYPLSPHSELERIVLPLGLSIICIQQVAILFALVRGETELPDPVRYARHSLFLPQLFAGPIVLPSAWCEPPSSNEAWDDSMARGIGAFAVGLAKAAILGEEAFRFVQPFLTEASFTSLTVIPALLFLLGSALAAYFFISGFCDMAFGIGLMVGIKLPAHVDAPFRPSAAARVWHHWSITLHIALRDVVMPKAQAVYSGLRTAVAMALVLALSLLWHGDVGILLGLAAVVGVASVVWCVALRVTASLRVVLQYLSVIVAGTLAFSLLAVGALQPWLAALSGLASDQLGLRDVFVHQGQTVWQLVLIALALVWLPFELSTHALFDPEADSERRKLFGWVVPAWSLSPVWVGVVLILLVVGVWRAGTVRDSIYFGF